MREWSSARWWWRARLKQRRRSEFALIRRAPDERVFAVQLAGNKPEEMAWAAALVEARGADFVDVNLGCPIDHFTRMGLGAALGRQPNKVGRIVAAMRAAVKVPVTVKIRLGWNSDSLNYMTLAKAAVDSGASAVFVHGRTREARYRHPADWDRSRNRVRAPGPRRRCTVTCSSARTCTRVRSDGCRRSMARGALIKPDLPRSQKPATDIFAEERLAIYRRYVALALDRGVRIGAHQNPRVRLMARRFLVLLCPAPPTDRGRRCRNEKAQDAAIAARALLARTDDAALDYVTDQLPPTVTVGPPSPVRAGSDAELCRGWLMLAA